LHLDDRILGRDTQLMEELGHEARDGRLADARVAREDHVPDGVERLLALLLALNIQRELLAQPLHVVLDRLHAHQLGEFLVHRLLGRRQLLRRQRLGFGTVVLVGFLIFALASASTPTCRRTFLLRALFECIHSRKVFIALVANGLLRDRVFLVFERCDEVFGRLAILVDRILVVPQIVRVNRLIGDRNALITHLIRHR